MNPPYGMDVKYNSITQSRQIYFPDKFGNYKSSVIAFMYLTINLLAEDGEATLLIPYG